MNKRGISPLIATVLIIGFTIVIAAIVITFGTNIVKTTTQNTENTNKIINLCSEIDINAKSKQDTAYLTNNQINVIIKNNKGTKIEGFIFKAESNTQLRPLIFYAVPGNLIENSGQILVSGNPATPEVESYSIKTYGLGGIDETYENIYIKPVIFNNNEITACNNEIKIKISNEQSSNVELTDLETQNMPQIPQQDNEDDELTSDAVFLLSFNNPENRYEDKSSNGNHAIPGNDIEIQKPVYTEEGCNTIGCYNFDGIDDYMSVTEHDSLRITGDITISAWIKINSIVKDSNILSYGTYDPSPLENEKNNVLYVLRLTGTGGIKYLHESSTGVNDLYTWTLDLQTNSLYHIILVRDTTLKTVKLYVNGVENSNIFNYDNNPTGSGDGRFEIGRDNILRNNYPYYFNGIIDDIIIIPRTLTSDEINSL